jgi:hypothetical protein
MTQEEKNWILGLQYEKKIDLLETALKENRTMVFIQFSLIFLEAPISQGGISTEEIESLRKKHCKNP